MRVVFFTLVCACKRYIRCGLSRRGARVVFRIFVVVIWLVRSTFCDFLRASLQSFLHIFPCASMGQCIENFPRCVEAVALLRLFLPDRYAGSAVQSEILNGQLFIFCVVSELD